MQALVEVILPVFLVIGAGYASVWGRILTDDAIDGVMSFTLTVAVPCLLFRAISTLDLGDTFEPRLLGVFYFGATTGFFLGILGARTLFGRNWPDAVAIGFCALFSNGLLLGLPITERAYGPDSLAGNYAIVSVHAPFCYGLGVIAMEVARAGGGGIVATLRAILLTMSRNALVVGIVLGFLVNVSGISMPSVAAQALDLVARAALPAALFGMGGILYRYRLEGSVPTIAWICAISLLIHPALVFAGARLGGFSVDATRSAVLTAAMAPGINAYVFAHMYGVARRVAASAVLIGTAASLPTIWIWLAVLP